MVLNADEAVAPMSLSLSLLFALIAAMPAGVWADVLLGTNGERLIGRVIEENAGSVVFDSELGGRLNIRRERVRELQRTTVTTDWLPRPPPPDDRFDWVELKSGEWLKGRIKSMQDEKLEFDSEELDIRVFDWKDIRTVRSPRLHSVRFETKANADGSLVITTNRVEVISNNITNTYSREELLAITPTGARESSKWTAKVIAGMNQGSRVQRARHDRTPHSIDAAHARLPRQFWQHQRCRNREQPANAGPIRLFSVPPSLRAPARRRVLSRPAAESRSPSHAGRRRGL
jgi:hypothetical protein